MGRSPGTARYTSATVEPATIQRRRAARPVLKLHEHRPLWQVSQSGWFWLYSLQQIARTFTPISPVDHAMHITLQTLCTIIHAQSRAELPQQLLAYFAAKKPFEARVRVAQISEDGLKPWSTSRCAHPRRRTGVCRAHHLARKRVQHSRQVQPAAAPADVDTVLNVKNF